MPRALLHTTELLSYGFDNKWCLAYHPASFHQSQMFLSDPCIHCKFPVPFWKISIQVERPWDLVRDSGQRSWHIPIRITVHPRGAFISVGDWTPTETNLLLLTTWRSGSLLDWDKIKSRQITVYERSTYNITTKRFLFYCKICMLYIYLWGIARACLKNAFCKMCITICGRFYLNEGGVAGYVNWMKAA